jgi:hypothetical protein
VGSEHDSAEEVTAARGYEGPRSYRTTAERDEIVCEVVHDLVEEFLRETWSSGDIGR